MLVILSVVLACMLFKRERYDTTHNYFSDCYNYQLSIGNTSLANLINAYIASYGDESLIAQCPTCPHDPSYCGEFWATY